MVSLLASRGRGRRHGGGGVLGVLGRIASSLWAGKRNDNKRAGLGSGTVAAIACACLGIGYLLGDSFPLAHRSDPLRAPAGNGAVEPQRPGLLEDQEKPLSSTWFVVSVYVTENAEAGRAQARALARYLRDQGLDMARPALLELQQGSFWSVAVYFDGPAARDRTRARLVALPADVPDAEFVRFRANTPAKDWPLLWPPR